MAQKISRPAGRNRPPSAQKTAGAKATAAPVPRRKTPADERVENLILGTLLFILAVLVFLPAFGANFIWDDDQLLTQSPIVHDPQGWWKVWVQGTADYFPLTTVSLWLEYQLGHLLNLNYWNIPYLQRYAGDPTSGAISGYHVTNVLFHATAVVLTWQALKRLRIPGAAWIAAIFAVHPICVESVAWISERKNTISQIFFLLSIIQYVRFEEQGRLRKYLWAIACFTLSLLAKTSVVMLPFILLILAWGRSEYLVPLRSNYELEENSTERGILLWTCAAAGAVFLGGLVVVAAMLGIAGIGSSESVTWSLLGAGAILGGFIGYAIAPQVKKAKFWNSFAGFELVRMLPFFLVAFLLGLVTVYFQYGKAIGGEEIPIGAMWQRACSACFAVGFYLYSALWPFKIIEIYPQWHRAFSIVITQPSIHTEPPERDSIPYYLQIIPGLLIGGLLFFSWLRRKETWARALLVGLGCYIVAMLPALGMLKMSYMRLTLVADHFQYISIVAVIALVVAAGFTRSLRLPWLLFASVVFGVIAYVNWDQTAENHFAEVLWVVLPLALAAASVVREFWKQAWLGFLVVVLLCFSVITWAQTGNYKNEETLWSATLEKNPYSWQAHNHLGAALYMRGDVKDAFPHFLAATKLKPENPESHNNLGLAYSYFNMKDEAVRQYEIAVKIKDDPSMATNLANAYEEAGRLSDAIDEYKHALTLNPNTPSATCNLGYALMQQGKVDEAIGWFIKTIELDPAMPQGRGDLFRALQAHGIDINNPDYSKHYPFDLHEAIELLRSQPPPRP